MVDRGQGKTVGHQKVRSLPAVRAGERGGPAAGLGKLGVRCLLCGLSAAR